MNQNTLIAFLATLIAFLPVSRPPKKHPCINIEQYGKHQHTSSTHGSWKNSLLLSSSCRTVIPSVGPLPRMLSRSRDCDSSQVWINLAGSSAKDRRNVCFKWELCKDCASKAIWLTSEEWSAEAPSVSFFRMARRSGFLYLFIQLCQCSYWFFRHLDRSRHTIFESRIFHFYFDIPSGRSFWRWHSRIQKVVQDDWFGASQMPVYKFRYLLKCDRFCIKNLRKAWAN